jgi:hypothetical protein
MAKKTKKVMTQAHVTAHQNGSRGGSSGSARNVNYTAKGGAQGVGKGGSGQGAKGNGNG